MKKYITALISFIFPSFIAVSLLRLFKHKIGKGCRIGFSIIIVEQLKIDDYVTIGHFNILKCDVLDMGIRAKIGKLNAVSGQVEIILLDKAAIGNFNIITRAKLGVTYGKAKLQLGVLTKLTSFHKIDLTRSVIIGDYSILAGQSSQVWTHGYYHHHSGPGRFRVDGEVHIGNNVYIGSACLINAGIKIADGITVGSNSTVSKSLTKSGMYVSQPLRYIESDPLEVEQKLKPVTGYDICETVYEKEL